MNKNIYNQNESKFLEKIKWLSIFGCVILSIVSNYYFYEKSLFIRMTSISFFILCAMSIIIYTKKGRNIFSYIQMSKKEMQKIIWPEYKETLYTTCIVICITIIISLILWGIDNIIFRLITFIISLRL